MSDRFAAEIEIGGPITAPQMSELFTLVTRYDLGADWGCGPPDTHQELYGELREGETLWLCSDHAAYGEFPDLERFLVDHDIAFDRRSEAGCECGPELVWFRPGMERPSTKMLSMDNEEVIEVSRLKPVIDALDYLDIDTARIRMMEVLGPSIPPLEPFRIVEDA